MNQIAIGEAIAQLDTIALSYALDAVLDFQTVIADMEGTTVVCVGDYIAYPVHGGDNWGWERAFEDGAPVDRLAPDGFADTDELFALLIDAGYAP
jgi:hypothetical protein